MYVALSMNAFVYYLSVYLDKGGERTWEEDKEEESWMNACEHSQSFYKQKKTLCIKWRINYLLFYEKKSIYLPCLGIWSLNLNLNYVHIFVSLNFSLCEESLNFHSTTFFV